MANYKQSTITGDSYIRGKRVILENQLGVIPSVTFIEEEILNLDGRTIKTPYPPNGVVLFEQMTVPETEFNLLDPTTDNVIGTATYSQIYAIMYSLHRHLAAIRDANP